MTEATAQGERPVLALLVRNKSGAKSDALVAVGISAAQRTACVLVWATRSNRVENAAGYRKEERRERTPTATALAAAISQTKGPALS